MSEFKVLVKDIFVVEETVDAESAVKLVEDNTYIGVLQNEDVDGNLIQIDIHDTVYKFVEQLDDSFIVEAETLFDVKADSAEEAVEFVTYAIGSGVDGVDEDKITFDDEQFDVVED